MKRKFKSLLCLALSAVMLNGISATAFAQESTPKYKETYLYVDFANLDINKEQDEWTIEPKNNLSRSANISAESDIDKLKTLIEEFPDVKENLFSKISENEELICVSFTEVPLILINDHYERIPVNTNSNARNNNEVSDSNGKGKFLLYTKITGGTTEVTGGYKYYASTYGSWSENGLLGHSDYPAAGDDFVFQTSPSTFSRISDSMSAIYDNTPIKGVSGDDYWKENGDSTYVRYGIADDPSGYRQNTSFILTTTSAGPQSKTIRHIGSYYVHTWAEMNVSASISASSNKSVTLTITPSISEKSWQVYNYVPFSF